MKINNYYIKNNKFLLNLLYIIFLSVIIFNFNYIFAIKNKKGFAMDFKLRSLMFEDGGLIPKEFTCEGDNISPPLLWTGQPEKTKTYAIICQDPDSPVGIWVHWIIFNIPSSLTRLPSGIPLIEKMSDGTMQGKNDFKKLGYGGPCPPSGTHRYFFSMFALDTKLYLPKDATKKDLVNGMQGHVLAQAQLIGKYQRTGK